MSASTLVGPLLQSFFIDNLRAQKRLSDQTVASYRDTFRLLLRSIHHETAVGPAALTISYGPKSETRAEKVWRLSRARGVSLGSGGAMVYLDNLRPEEKLEHQGQQTQH
jgi:hypothetical protein